MTESKNTLDWFKFANTDLNTARHLYETMWPRPLEHICYCCQQSAEKFIKGVMLKFGMEIIKTHDLVKLCNSLRGKADTSQIDTVAAILTIYAAATRYPVGFDVDDDETKAAITRAQKIKSWALSLVQLDAEAQDEAAKDDATEHRVQDSPQE